MKSIQSMAAMAGREARANGLPCGDYVYSDPLSIANRYQSEGDVIRAKYGTVDNWYAWEMVRVTERATGRRVFDNEIAGITGHDLTNTPAAVLAFLNPALYEVKV
jgi:hypothetical protein